jgi:hypothetical protein
MLIHLRPFHRVRKAEVDDVRRERARLVERGGDIGDRRRAVVVLGKHEPPNACLGGDRADEGFDRAAVRVGTGKVVYHHQLDAGAAQALVVERPVLLQVYIIQLPKCVALDVDLDPLILEAVPIGLQPRLQLVVTWRAGIDG